MIRITALCTSLDSTEKFRNSRQHYEPPFSLSRWSGLQLKSGMDRSNVSKNAEEGFYKLLNCAGGPDLRCTAYNDFVTERSLSQREAKEPRDAARGPVKLRCDFIHHTEVVGSSDLGRAVQISGAIENQRSCSRLTAVSGGGGETMQDLFCPCAA